MGSDRKSFPQRSISESSMNKLLLAALLGFTLIAVTAGTEDNHENSLKSVEAEVEQLREVREAGQRRKKKGGKKKGKKSKRGKKGKKGRKAKKAKKARKSKKVKKSRGKVKSIQKGQTRQSADKCEMMSYCLTNMTKYMNQHKEKYSNFIRQYNRIAKFGKLNKNKGGKKGAFKGLSDKIIEKGGSNASKLMCQGSDTSAGAMTMKEVVAKLASCEMDIHKACSDGAPTANQTELDACKAKMDAFNESVTACVKKTDDTKCTCWTGEDLKMKSAAIAKCNLKDTMASFTSAKKKCTKAFAACRQEEDKGNKVLFICDKSQSSDKLIKKVADLTNNIAAVEAMIKMVKAKVTRRVRSATCGSMAKEVDKVAEMSMKAPTSPNVAKAAKAVMLPSASCKGDAAVQASIAKAESGAENMKELKTSIQEEIKAQTGSTASSAQVESAGGASVTTATSKIQLYFC